jgi:hypothetical protein
LNAKIKEPDDFNIDNIKKRKSLNTFETHVAKKEFYKKDKVNKDILIQKEIEKTLEELYGH